MARLILRGGLSGLVGSLLYLIGHALNERLRLGYVPYGGAMELMALPYVAAAGIVCGSLIGFLLWAIANKLDLQLPGYLRAIVGVLFLLFSWVALYLYWGPSETRLIPRPLINQFIEGALGLTLFGALPGVAARPMLLHQDTAESAKCRLLPHRRLQLACALLTLVVALFLTALVLRVHGHAPPGIKDQFGFGEEMILSTCVFRYSCFASLHWFL